MKPDDSAPIVKHPVETRPEDALKYWTADKMRKAKPANMPQTTALKRRKKHAQQAPHPSDSQPD